ncbi:MAG: hypothetical protein IT427_06595 [Pirellulales bacterium]|nr:hypothetical protein [Pirellulales bacterium]
MFASSPFDKTTSGGVALDGGSFQAAPFGNANELLTMFATALVGVADGGGVWLGLGETNVDAENNIGAPALTADGAASSDHPGGASISTMLPHLGHPRICPTASGLVTRRLRRQVVHWMVKGCTSWASSENGI